MIPGLGQLGSQLPGGPGIATPSGLLDGTIVGTLLDSLFGGNKPPQSVDVADSRVREHQRIVEEFPAVQRYIEQARRRLPEWEARGVPASIMDPLRRSVEAALPLTRFINDRIHAANRIVADEGYRRTGNRISLAALPILAVVVIIAAVLVLSGWILTNEWRQLEVHRSQIEAQERLAANWIAANPGQSLPPSLTPGSTQASVLADGVKIAVLALGSVLGVWIMTSARRR